MILPSVTRRMGRSFAQLLEARKEGETEIAYKRGYVPATLYFLIGDHRRILGAIHFRHKLNERMMVNGGNIGYGVRPSERGKGYASKMLGLLLAIFRNEGVGKVLLTCDEDNLGSIKTIERHNTILEDKVLFEGT